MLIIFLLFVGIMANGQNKLRMQDFESRLTNLIVKVAEAPTDNERYLASEQAVQLLSSALDEEESEKWRWKLPDVPGELPAWRTVF